MSDVSITFSDAAGERIRDYIADIRKLVERSGIKKEMRRREYYEKPSEIKRRARLRAERRARRRIRHTKGSIRASSACATTTPPSASSSAPATSTTSSHRGASSTP